ncbi:MAG TPA: hypothetical protein VJ010_06055 [Actinomycetota bacterium]|nr:hypothetical protein [Actinomycetota bacterium]
MSIAGRGPSMWHRHEAALLAVLSVIVIAGSVVGGAAFFKTGEATNHGSARCYTVLSVGSGTSFMGTTIVAPGQVGSPEQVQSAIAGCASLWRQGFLTAGSMIRHPPQAGQNSGTIPPLVACTLPDGTAAVFPAEGPFTCGRLGLASPRSQSHTP